MPIYDISRELFSTPIYPGDPQPAARQVGSINRGDMCNLTAISLCTHNATHVDAPLHFLENGGDVTTLPLETCVGPCVVVNCKESTQGHSRVLFRGCEGLTAAEATALAEAGVRLIGTERSSVADETCTTEVHRILLEAGIVLLENIDLSQVPEGSYCLSALPLKMAGVEASPCRAVLFSD